MAQAGHLLIGIYTVAGVPGERTIQHDMELPEHTDYR